MVVWRQFLILAMVSSLSVLAANVLAPIEARFVQSITNNAAWSGSVFAVGSLVFAVGAFYIGRLSDRYGRRRLLLVGLIISVIYPLLYASSLNVLHLYGVKFAWAISAVTLGPVLAAYVQDVLADVPRKGRYFGYIYSLQSIAGSAGALLGGYVAESFGLAAPLYVLLGIYVTIFAIVWWFLPQDKIDSDDIQSTTSPSIRSLVTTACATPELRFYLLVNTAFGINWGIKSFLWPLLIFALAGSDLITGSIFATMGVIAFLLLPFVGLIVDEIGPFKTALLQLIVLSISGITMALTNILEVFWIMAGLYTIGEVLNVWQAVVLTEHIPRSVRGAMMGLDATMDRLLQTIAPVIAGVLITVIGIQTTFLLFMLLFVVAFAIALWLYQAVSATTVASKTQSG